jgi:hypothetical protein
MLNLLEGLVAKVEATIGTHPLIGHRLHPPDAPTEYDGTYAAAAVAPDPGEGEYEEDEA